MITADDVRTAYRFYLGREPESAEVVARLLQQDFSLAELRRHFLSSAEFRMAAPATADDVRAAYRLILGRDAENEEVVAGLVQRRFSLTELRRYFLNSREFRNAAATADIAKPLDWEPMPLEIDGSPEEIARMLSRIELYWRDIDVPEVHWRLHQRENFMASSFTESEEHFYGDGQELIQIFRRTAARCGISLDDYQVCLELGCGVGRLTVWLAELLPKILAMDISRLRLELNQRALARYGRANVEHHHLVTIDSIASLPDFDAFFSIIVLQHNPPPIIATLLTSILSKLRVGGIAYFQVPTFIKDYTFTIDGYLREAPRQSQPVMEMHAIPQKRLFDILNDCNCELLEIREDPWTESAVIISNSVLVKKH